MIERGTHQSQLPSRMDAIRLNSLTDLKAFVIRVIRLSGLTDLKRFIIRLDSLTALEALVKGCRRQCIHQRGRRWWRDSSEEIAAAAAARTATQRGCLQAAFRQTVSQTSCQTCSALDRHNHSCGTSEEIEQKGWLRAASQTDCQTGSELIRQTPAST